MVDTQHSVSVLLKIDAETSKAEKFRKTLEEIRALGYDINKQGQFTKGGKFVSQNEVASAMTQNKATQAQQTDMLKKEANQRKAVTTAQRQNLVTGLGTLFFMQGLEKSLLGLLTPAAELVGIFDIWSLIMTMLFLPVMLKLLPLFLWLLKAVNGLPEPVKELIGWLVVTAAVIAGVIAALAALGLFLSSWGLVELGGAAIMGLIAVLGEFLIPVLLAVAALIVLIAAIKWLEEVARSMGLTADVMGAKFADAAQKAGLLTTSQTTEAKALAANQPERVKAYEEQLKKENPGLVGEMLAGGVGSIYGALSNMGSAMVLGGPAGLGAYLGLTLEPIINVIVNNKNSEIQSNVSVSQENSARSTNLPINTTTS